MRARLIWRIVATIMAMSAIYFIWYPLMISKAFKDEAVQVLVTDGFSPDSLKKGENTFTFDKAIASKNPGIKYYSSTSLFNIRHPGLARIKMYGHGLSDDQLHQLSPADIDFIPGDLSGLVKAGWTTLVDDHFHFQGLYRNNLPGKIVIKLFSFNTVLDSVQVNAHADSAIVLNAIPQLSGLSLFRIAGLQGRDTLFNYPVPFYAVPQVKPRILLISSSPDFEFKYLRNWLFDNGYSVSTYSPVSRGRSVAVFSNNEKTVLSTLSRSTLDNTDLLILDEGALSNNANIIAGGVGRGMGLLVNTASSINRSIVTASVRPVPVTGNNFRISLGGGTSVLNPLMVDEPRVIASGSNRQVLAKLGNNALVQQHIFGLGRVSVSTVLQSYQWLLRGNKDDYARYWSHLINKTARQTTPALLFQSSTAFPIPGQKMTLQIAAPDPDSILINKLQLPLEQVLGHPGNWKTFYWPSNKGWQEVAADSKLKSWFYVYDPADWKEARAAERIDLNRQIIYKEKKTAEIAAPKNLSQPRPVPAWIWFLMFLLGAGFLWWERKKP